MEVGKVVKGLSKFKREGIGQRRKKTVGGLENLRINQKGLTEPPDTDRFSEMGTSSIHLI